MGCSDDCEWLLWIERIRTLGDRLRGRNKTPDPQVARDLHAIVTREPAITNVLWSHMEPGGSESTGAPEP